MQVCCCGRPAAAGRALPPISHRSSPGWPTLQQVPRTPHKPRLGVAASSSSQQQPPQTSRAARGKAAAQPEPGPHQQTLRRPFTVGGVGLHTGEYAHVRVLPAFAGDGRYFVRVPPGTLSPLWQVEQPVVQPLEEVRPAGAPAAGEVPDEDWNAKLFFSFIEGQESGSFTGTFADYLQQRAGMQADSLVVDAEAELLADEEPRGGQPGEARLPAHASSLQQGHRWCTVLSQGGNTVWGAEHLLAALECCGVDNARIEVEGGQEVPIIDGSAVGWATEAQRAGVRVAPSASGAEGPSVRSIPAPPQVMTVRDGESFITFFPGPTARVTVGVDCSSEAPVIGRQWFTWGPDDAASHPGDSFGRALAPARTFFASVETVRTLTEEGLLQGGPDYVSIIGQGEDWLDESLVRFPRDEAARHSMVDLLGDLSLLACPGGRGLPAGHVVAYRPTHALHAEFVLKLQLSMAV